MTDNNSVEDVKQVSMEVITRIVERKMYYMLEVVGGATASDLLVQAQAEFDRTAKSQGVPISQFVQACIDLSALHLLIACAVTEAQQGRCANAVH